MLHVVSGDLWAGAEVQAYQLLRAARREHGVVLRAVVLNPGILAERLGAEGVAVSVLDETRLGFGSLAREIRMLARAWQPNVVHTHRRKEHFLGAIAAHTCGAGLVATIHGRNEFPHTGIDLRRRALRMAERLLLSRVYHRLVAVSDDLVTTLPGAEHHKVVIPNGVDVAQVRDASGSAAAALTGRRSINLGFLGRLAPVKQVDRMLHMMQRLESFQPGRWALHIVGDGPLRGELGELTAALGLQQAVTFHGFLPNPLPLLAQMDLFLFASAHEGLPMTALEALALGVPIVSPPINSLERLIDEAAAGAVARSAHSEDLADAVLAMQLPPRVESALRPALLPERYRIEHGVARTMAVWREAAGRTGV